MNLANHQIVPDSLSGIAGMVKAMGLDTAQSIDKALELVAPLLPHTLHTISERIAVGAPTNAPNTTSGGALLAKPLAEPTLPEETNPGQAAMYRIKRNGDLWEIQFGDEKTNLIHCKGMDYLVNLLKHPYSQVLALSLEGVVGKTSSEMREAYGNELSVQTKQWDPAAGDETLLKDLRKKLRELDLEFAGRTNVGDKVECAIISTKITNFLNFAKKTYRLTAKHLRGVSDPFKGREASLSCGNEAHKAFARVKHHINKLKARLAQPQYQLTTFLKHIKAHIRECGNRSGYVYEPRSNAIAWNFS